MENNETKLKKGIRNYNKLLIVAIIFIIISIYFSFKSLEKAKEPLPQPVNMLSTDEEGKYATIDVQTSTDAFAKDDINSYSFVSDQNKYMYVVSLSNEDILRLTKNTEYIYSNDENIELPEIVKITGVTHKINDDLKKLMIKSYNEIFSVDYVTDENAESYFGSVYLDTKERPVNNSFEIACSGISGIIGITLLIVYISMIFRTKKTIKKYILNNTLEYIYYQLSEIDTQEYNKSTVFLTREYAIDITNGLVIIKYDDIKWIYIYQTSRYGISISKSIIVVTNDNIKYNIMGMSAINTKTKKESFNTIFNEICKRSPNAMIGYTEENIRASKEKSRII